MEVWCIVSKRSAFGPRGALDVDLDCLLGGTRGVFRVVSVAVIKYSRTWSWLEEAFSLLYVRGVGEGPKQVVG